MVGQGHFGKPIKIFGRSYLPFIDRGTTPDNRSLLNSMIVCIESCGTGDISSSIAGIDCLCYNYLHVHEIYIVSITTNSYNFI